MPGPGLPANVDDPSWQKWLRAFPPSPDDSLGGAMTYRRALLSHLEEMPPSQLLTDDEGWRLGSDLAHYARILQASQRVSLRDGWASLGGAGVGLGIAMWIPGAQVVGAFIGAGFVVVAMARTYDVKRREGIINALVERIDNLSWHLKGR